MRRLAAAVVVALALVVTGCGSGSSKDPPAAGRGGRIFLIIGENTSASQITSKAAPYLVKTLKPKAAWISSYRSFTKSSSLGDYIAMTSGQFTKCEANNDLPDSCHQKVDNVFQQLQSQGRGWYVFNESAANACDIVDDGAAWARNIYSAHHNPAIYYVGLHGSGYDEAIKPKAPCRQRDLAMGTTGPNDTRAMDAALAAGRVGDLNVFIPNDCENGHDPCGTRNPVGQFDAFLRREVPKIRSSPAFGTDSTIIVTWDEGGDPPNNPGNPLLLAVGPGVKTGVVSNGRYNHYGLLRTLEDRFGLPHLAKARTAKSLPIFN